MLETRLKMSINRTKKYRKNLIKIDEFKKSNFTSCAEFGLGGLGSWFSWFPLVTAGGALLVSPACV